MRWRLVSGFLMWAYRRGLTKSHAARLTETGAVKFRVNHGKWHTI